MIISDFVRNRFNTSNNSSYNSNYIPSRPCVYFNDYSYYIKLYIIYIHRMCLTILYCIST